MPSLDGNFEPGYYYYDLEDPRAIEIFCKNDREVPKSKANNDWNWSATKF